MAKRQFKTESKKILDMMINSIYTHKEIFLRELVSNASDAIDKLYFKSLTDSNVGKGRDDFYIRITPDKDNKTLTISDNGIGMTEAELAENLGTIAKSGSGAFVAENDLTDDIDIIGKFGVGFYSAFMVADKIEVTSLAYGEKQAYKWTSTGADGYTITEADKDEVGTEIVLSIKADTENEFYSDYIDTYRLSEIVKRYSDYVRYPIRMEMERGRKNEESGEYETYKEDTVLNSMVPLWRKQKKDIKPEEYEGFYKDKFHQYEKPLGVIHQRAEGTSNYQALMFIPGKADFNYYSRDFEKGLKLYSRGVLITDSCAELLPDCFSFVKGLVDTEDLTLNVSRETLQADHQVKVIATALQKRIKKELADMLKNRREDYETFFKEFGLNLKYSLYRSYGMDRELVEDLLMFQSAEEQKYVTLKEYSEAMPEEQKYIYYAAGADLAGLSNTPQAELVRSKGFDILCFTDDVDEFNTQILGKYADHEFRSVTGGDLGLESEDEKKEKEEKQKEYEDMFTFMQEKLDGKVTAVRLSSSLKSHPVCITADGPLSIEMEKILKSMPNSDNSLKAEKVLELNGEHRVFETLTKLWPENKDKVEAYTKLLYNQALLIEGLQIEDPLAFANEICELMV